MNRDLAITGNGRALGSPVMLGEAHAHGRQLHAPQLDFATLVRIIRDWRWLIAAAAALGLVGGTLLTILTPPQYRSWVTLEVNPPAVEIMDEQRRDRSQAATSWDHMVTQVGLLQSRTLAERVAQDLDLVSNASFVTPGGDASARLRAAADKVAGGLKVEMPEDGQLIRFSYSTKSPEMAATVANGIAEGFINANLQRRFEASAYARQFLERQIVKTRADLERSERQLTAYAQSQGIIHLSSGNGSAATDGSNSLQGDSLAALNRALADATARRVAAEGAYRQARSSGPTAEVNASTQALRQSRASLEAEYQDKRTLMKPEHPEMLSLRSRIEELDRQIARETAQVSGGRSNTLAQDYRAALAAERSLQGQVAKLKSSVLDLRGRSVRYNILQREVDTNRGLYDALLQRYKEIGVAGGVGSAPVSIVDRAEVPGGPFTPSLPKNLLMGLGLGLLGGLGGALGVEFLNDRIRTREDVRTKLQLPCLGAIPRAPGTTFADELKDAGSAISEAYSSVAAGLQFSTESGTPKALLVTSTQPSEGKSSTALALAQNFARRGSRVLLVDGDLRKPSFRAASDEIGLTPLLTNDDELAGHVTGTQYDGLWLLPCGPLPPNPADLLATPRFGTIIEEALASFDIVIIDAPPVLGLADVPLLASAAGSVLFVVESGNTRTRSAIEALNRIEASGAHVLGAVLAKSKERDRAYDYHSYRYGTLQDRSRARIALIPHQADA